MSLPIKKHLDNLLSAIKTRPVIISTTVAATLSLIWIISDFQAWKSFGTGGSAPTWSGYWRMTKLRVQRFLLFGKDKLTDASPLSSTGPSYLDSSAVPIRKGPRPPLQSRVMPQRQIPYHHDTVAAGVKERMRDLVATFAARHPDILQRRPSKTEGGSTDAIYGNPTLDTLNPLTKSYPILGTEIAHVHPAESSLHVWLSQRDARTVIERGWAERFPLAFVDKGWVMVYSPRSMAEVDVVETIVKAAVGNVTGVRV